MDYNKLADILYPDVKHDINYYFDKYPKRNIGKDAIITRFAPSPTGYLHVGGLFQSIIHQMLSRGAGSEFYLRLEDTDQKREISDSGAALYYTLLDFDVEPTEGYRADLGDKGNYGPYKQSERIEIYKTFAKYLVSRGNAFPCFCEKFEDKSDIVAKREQEIEDNNDTIDHDICRNLTLEEIEQKLKEGKPFALRLRSQGNPDNVFEIEDLVKGKRKIRENGKDVVLVKNNGVPVYAFAHCVDDTLMQTSIIVRGEDWFQSLACHLEIFKAFGFEPIQYLHTPNICKLEDGKKRKISKRKDPEADCRYYLKDGYPTTAVKEYLLNLVNSDFEEWRRENPTKSYLEFPFSISKFGSGNPMFDFAKLNDISKDLISRLTAEQVYNNVLSWAENNDKDFALLLEKNKDFAIKTFNIDRDTPKPRKDIYKWSMVKEYYNFMFEDFNNIDIDFSAVTNLENELICSIIDNYTELFNKELDKNSWFENVKELASKYNFATDNKLYKANPENYNGNVASFCTLIRYAFTGKVNTPDLFEICNVLGIKELQNRVNIIKNK